MLDNEEIIELATSIADEKDADILLFSSPLFSPIDIDFIKNCRSRKRKKNIVILLTTPGGQAEVAFRIGRCLQRAYSAYSGESEPRGKISIFIDTYCKSAGTILSLCADELIMSQIAELGPTDVQLRNADEVGERMSGLTPTQSLETLQGFAASTFSHIFREMRFGSETSFSTRMAAELASSMSTGLLAQIYSQIDPLKLGENERYVRIAAEYGERLATANVKSETISKLVAGYPSHDFVIDRLEAESLFNRVIEPDDCLEQLAQSLRPGAVKAMYGEACQVEFLNYSEASAEMEDASKKRDGAGRRAKAKTSKEIQPVNGKDSVEAAESNATLD